MRTRGVARAMFEGGLSPTSLTLSTARTWKVYSTPFSRSVTLWDTVVALLSSIWAHCGMSDTWTEPKAIVPLGCPDHDALAVQGDGVSRTRRPFLLRRWVR